MSRREARKAAFFGIPSGDFEKQKCVTGLRAGAANAAAIRDEAAREYEYMHRTLESLDSKATGGVAGALALMALAAALGGPAWARWTGASFALVAGIFAATVLAPENVRGVRTLPAVQKYGTVSANLFLMQIANQYLDAVEATRFLAMVKAIRLRVALVLLLLSTVCMALR